MMTDMKFTTVTFDAVRPHLFGYGVPVQVALTLVHTLLVQELTLVRNKQGVAHKLPNCNNKVNSSQARIT